MSPLTTSVRSLRWLGLYCESEPNGRVSVPTQLASNFLVAFYADQQGFPSFATGGPSGSALSSGIYTPEQAGERFLRSEDRPCGSTASPAAIYEYSLRLSDPVPVNRGTRYWVGIQALMTHTRIPACAYIDCVHWGWHISASFVDGYSFHPYFQGIGTFDWHSRCPSDQPSRYV